MGAAHHAPVHRDRAMNLRTLCLAATLGCIAAAQAAPVLDKEEMQARKVRIEDHYDQSQARCRRVEGQARRLCNERARGERDVDVAALEMEANPTPENDQRLRLAKADARYATSLVQCRELDGQARRLCRDDAKRVLRQAKEDARLQVEVAAQALRSENTVRARTAEAERIADAQFRAARARCDALPAEGRANCLDDAKKRFGKM
jgi:hypothetical protein